MRIRKAAVVTGGSGDIGRAICRSLAELGYLTAVCYRSDRSSAESLAEELTARGLTARAFYCDISDMSSIRACYEDIRSSLGPAELLVNNAGRASIGLFTDLTDQQLEDLISVDLTGAIRMTRVFLPDMLAAHRGSVINISSVWGECGASCEAVYSAAKAGLIGFTKALGKECAPSGVRVNCVSCGLIDTKMNSSLSQEELQAVIDDIPAGRMGTPEDVARAVAFLAEDGEYITGQTLRVDGGWI